MDLQHAHCERPEQDFGVASATEKIQENARRHDADALKLFDRQKIGIAGHDHRRAAFDCRGKVLVIVCAYADALELGVTSDELSQ
jgi:hypothetical protein